MMTLLIYLKIKIVKPSTDGSKVGTRLAKNLADTDVDGPNTVQVTLVEVKILLSPQVINHQSLRNILKVVKVTGAENAKNKAKVFIIAVKMLQKEITSRDINEHFVLLEYSDSEKDKVSNIVTISCKNWQYSTNLSKSGDGEELG